MSRLSDAIAKEQPGKAEPDPSNISNIEIGPHHYSVTNEHTFIDRLHNTEPLQRPGVVVAVGSTQGLDLFAAGQAEQLYVVDSEPTTTLTTEAYLEAAARFTLMMDRMPDPFELRALQNRCELLVELLSLPFPTEQHLRSFTESELAYLKARDTTMLNEYLTDAAGDPHSWVQNSHLQRLVSAYLDGRVSVHTGDITDASSSGVIPQILQHGAPISIVYPSNIIPSSSIYLPPQKRQGLGQVMDMIGHHSPDCVVISAISGIALPGEEPIMTGFPYDWWYLLQDAPTISAQLRQTPAPRSGYVGCVESLPGNHTLVLIADGVYREQQC